MKSIISVRNHLERNGFNCIMSFLGNASGEGRFSSLPAIMPSMTNQQLENSMHGNESHDSSKKSS
jgi:hypothetical protein